MATVIGFAGAGVPVPVAGPVPVAVPVAGPVPVPVAGAHDAML